MQRDQLYTLLSMPVSLTGYQIIENFLEDFKLEEGLPDRDNIFLELAVQKGTTVIGGNKSLNRPVELGNIQLMTIDSMSDNTTLLVAVGESDEYLKLLEEFNEDIDEDNSLIDLDDPEPYVVLCSDYNQNYDLQVLSTTFVEYLQDVGGVLTFEELQTRYYTSEQLVNEIYNGIEPDDDE